jgi:prepilin-type N-terminal cleavage/methylation domain-containing protein
MRRGFTLIEVMVGLVITSLVAGLAYATLQGGLETSARLDTHRTEHEASAIVQGLIHDAVRHALPGVPGGPATFVLVDRLGPDGRASDSLTFQTRGIVQPLGTSGSWWASVSRHADTLRFVAWPELGGAAPVVADVTPVRSLDVAVLGRSTYATWSSRWLETGVAPDAARLVLGDRLLVARRGLERAP